MGVCCVCVCVCMCMCVCECVCVCVCVWLEAYLLGKGFSALSLVRYDICCSGYNVFLVMIELMSSIHATMHYVHVHVHEPNLASTV